MELLECFADYGQIVAVADFPMTLQAAHTFLPVYFACNLENGMEGRSDFDDWW